MMCLKIMATTGLMILGLAVSHGQEVEKPKVVVDEAPPPSERFPAAWYSAQDGQSTTAPVVGSPYTATMLLKTVTEFGGDKPAIASKIVTRMMRDSAGRTRTEEWMEVEGYPNPPLAGKSYQIEVNDTVQHCFFRWTEPVEQAKDKVATVNCLSRHLSRQDDGMTAKMSRQVPEITHDKFTTAKVEPLGERQIEGLKVLGVRQTATDLDSSGNPIREREMEVWWSPELQEIVLTRSLGKLQVPTLELKDVKRGEPAAVLFYPPAGFKIVRGDEPGR